MTNIDHWSSSIDLDYRYTAGVAGETFLRKIAKGRIMASRCSYCRLTYLPPRLYCEKCLRKIDTWVQVRGKGELYSYTMTGRGKKKSLYGLVKFAGIEGGLVGRIVGSDLADLKFGMPVRVDLKNSEKGLLVYLHV